MFADADVLTADFPSRTALEEEEEQLRGVAVHYADPPAVEITHEAGTSAFGCSLLLAVGRGPVAVVRAALGSDAEPLGTVTLPRLPTPPHLTLPGNMDRSAQLLLLPAGAPPQGGSPREAAAMGRGSVVAALVPEDVPPERCHAWAAAVLGALQPARVVVLSTMLGQDFRGGADPSEDALVFGVEAAAAAGAVRRAGLAPLPSGHLLGGLPAALLTACQLSGRPCVAGAAVQPMPVADARLVRGIAAAAAALARASGLFGGDNSSGAAQLGADATVAAAVRDVDAAYVASAAAAMYA